MATNIIIDPIRLQASRFPGQIWKRIEAEIKRTLESSVKDTVKAAMEKRTKNWERVDFAGRYSQYRGAVGAMTVFPRGPGRDKWIWVSGGVRARPIFPKRAGGKLLIRLGHKPKTTPQGGYGGPGTYAGPFVRASEARRWPGIKARNLEKFIKEDLEAAGDIVRLIDGAIRRAIP